MLWLLDLAGFQNCCWQFKLSSDAPSVFSFSLSLSGILPLNMGMFGARKQTSCLIIGVGLHYKESDMWDAQFPPPMYELHYGRSWVCNPYAVGECFDHRCIHLPCFRCTVKRWLVLCHIVRLQMGTLTAKWLVTQHCQYSHKFRNLVCLPTAWSFGGNWQMVIVAFCRCFPPYPFLLCFLLLPCLFTLFYVLDFNHMGRP